MAQLSHTIFELIELC